MNEYLELIMMGGGFTIFGALIKGLFDRRRNKSEATATEGGIFLEYLKEEKAENRKVHQENKELTERVHAAELANVRLEAEIQELRTENAELRARVEALSNRISKLEGI